MEYFVIFHIYLNVAKLAMQPASRLCLYQQQLGWCGTYIWFIASIFALMVFPLLVMLVLLMNGYSKGIEFDLSFLIQTTYLAGDH